MEQYVGYSGGDWALGVSRRRMPTSNPSEWHGDILGSRDWVHYKYIRRHAERYDHLYIRNSIVNIQFDPQKRSTARRI